VVDANVRSIIVGISDANRRLHRIALDLRAIRDELVEEGDDGEEEEDH
jgi:hypothetical protein